MKAVWRHFYFQIKKMLRAFSTPSVTVQYPEVLRKFPINARLSFFLDQKECTGCLDCRDQCPADAISIFAREFTDELVLPESSSGHIYHRQVTKFFVDYSRCVYCGICVDVCETSALLYSKNFTKVQVDVGALKENLIKTKELPKDPWRTLK